MNDTSTAQAVRFETAGIPALRRALLTDADTHETRAAETYADAKDGTALAAWCGLLLAASHNRMSAALLGLLSDPRVPADLAERGRYLVGQVLGGWPEALECANDDLPDAPPLAAQVPGQQEIPAEPDPDADAPSCRDCGTWPCARHATHEDRAEYQQATSEAATRFNDHRTQALRIQAETGLNIHDADTLASGDLT